MTILEFNDQLQRCDFEEIFSTSVMANDAQIVDALHDQLQHGIKGDGEQIGEYQSENYAKAKFQMNSQAGFGNVDLKLTGDFYSGMALRKLEKDFQINSDDEKNVDLQNKYGIDIMSLTDERAGQVAQDYILDEFIKEIREKLSLS